MDLETLLELPETIVLWPFTDISSVLAPSYSLEVLSCLLELSDLKACKLRES